MLQYETGRRNKSPPCCRDDPTRTDDPYVPNVVRYQLRYIPIAYYSGKPVLIRKRAVYQLFFLFLAAYLRKLIDVKRNTALKVCCLVFVDNTNFSKLVYHRIDFRSIGFG